MLFLFELAIFRVRQKIGYANTLPMLEGQSLIDFTNKDDLSVIFFHEGKPNALDFAQYGVISYSEKIRFAQSTINESLSYNCDAYPCVIPFKDGKRIDVQNAPLVSLRFHKWLRNITNPKEIQITHPEALRSLFNDHGSFVISVDDEPRPKEISKNEVLYKCPKDIFKFFNINVQKGIYVYRSADRQLRKVGRDLKHHLTANVIDPALFNLSSKKYLVGYFMDHTNSVENELEISILSELAPQYPDAHFFPLAEGIAAIFGNIGHMEYIDYPLFAVFNSSETNTSRWAYKGPELHNINFIKEFLDGIMNGSTPYNYISNQSPPTNDINFDMYQEVVENRTEDTIVVFTCSGFSRAKFYREMALRAAELTGVKTVAYNFSTNDIPIGMATPKQIPFAVLFPVGSEEHHITYEGNPNIKEYIDWIVDNAPSKPKMPNYSPKDEMNKLPPIDEGGPNITYADEVFGIPGEETIEKSAATDL